MDDAVNNTKVLVIDDDLKTLRMLEALLGPQGYAVETVANGPEGIARAAVMHPDIILLDLYMPEMDGIEVCRTLRSQPETEHIPVICITGYDDKSIKIRCLEAGANDFLAKPIDPTELTTRIKNLLFLGHYVSVSEENRVLRERRRAEEQFRRFIDSSQDMVYRTDATGTFTMINQAGVEMLGHRSVSEALGEKASDFWQSDGDRARMLKKS